MTACIESIRNFSLLEDAAVIVVASKGLLPVYRTLEALQSDAGIVTQCCEALLQLSSHAIVAPSVSAALCLPRVLTAMQLHTNVMQVTYGGLLDPRIGMTSVVDACDSIDIYFHTITTNRDCDYVCPCLHACVFV